MDFTGVSLARIRGSPLAHLSPRTPAPGADRWYSHMFLFTPLHRTLSDHPIAFGGLLLGVSLLLVISGVWGLKTGKACSESNLESTRRSARRTSWLRIFGGLLLGAWGVLLLLP